MTDGTLSKTQFAKTMGVDKAQASRWTAQGMPVAPDGSVPAAEAADWVRQHVRDYKARGSRGGAQLLRAENARWEQRLVTNCSLDIEYSAKFVAEALREVLPPDRVRALVERILGRFRAEMSLWLDEEIAPPGGLKSWADDPRFQGNQPREFNWTELLKTEEVEA